MRISRRKLLAGAGVMGFGATGGPARAAPRAHLRLLETSDLHMFVRDWDYYRQRTDPTVGLDRLATVIAEARTAAPNTLLFDNGDIIQGNPLGDYLADKSRAGASAVHPMFRAMNLLNYDAATVGNHEFNYGLEFLETALRGVRFPFVCANLSRADGTEYLPPFKILTRDIVDEDGARHVLRIGVIGFTPPQIMIWDKTNLDGRVTCSDILASARKFVPDLRARCDVLVALSHSGISTSPINGIEENASFHLASVPGIDVIFTGHSHRVFPGPDYAGRNGVDAERGTLNGVPAVMPGFWGSHLGIIDLALAKDGERWIVDHFSVEAKPIYRRDGGKLNALTTPDPAIDAAIESEHTAVNAWVSEPIGRFAAPVHSYFVFAGYDPASAIVNAAQIWYARPLLQDTPHAGLPILSAAAPFKAGYTPDAFVDIAAGPVARRDAADLYIYPNTLAAVRVTGAMLREWLEHAARVFNRIDPVRVDTQALVDTHVPSYNFDVIAGVTYRIDLSQAARYDLNGRLVDPSARRIVDLRIDGIAIDDAREFVVVTNNYRADGGGSFPGLDGSRTILRAPDTNRDAVIKYIGAQMTSARPAASPWTFAVSGQPIKFWFDSAIAARAHLDDVRGLRATGDGLAGFGRYELDIG